MSVVSVQRLVVNGGFGFAKFIVSPKTAEQPKLTDFPSLLLLSILQNQKRFME